MCALMCAQGPLIAEAAAVTRKSAGCDGDNSGRGDSAHVCTCEREVAVSHQRCKCQMGEMFALCSVWSRALCGMWPSMWHGARYGMLRSSLYSRNPAKLSQATRSHYVKPEGGHSREAPRVRQGDVSFFVT